MQLFSEVNNIGFLIFALSFLFLNWKYFFESYNYSKVFDFVFMFIALGYFIERLFFVLLNRAQLVELGWSRVLSLESLPLVVFNLDKSPGFSPVMFLIGGLIGLFVYNGVNTVNKVDFKALEGILRIFLITLLPWIALSLATQIVNSGDEQSALTGSLPWIIRLLLIVFVIGLYRVKYDFWADKQGFFAGLIILLFAITEIFIDYLDPDFTATIVGLFSVEQVFSILLIILAIDIFLTAISNIQDSIIRKKFAPTKQLPSRGFALSFANKRRISNPLNIRLKNLTKNSNRNRKSHEL